MFLSARSKTSGSGRRGGCDPLAKDNQISLALNGRAGKKSAVAMRVRIGCELMTGARFVAGDRLDLLFDENAGMGLIRRLPASTTDFLGWKLSVIGKVVKGKPNNGLAGIFKFSPSNEARQLLFGDDRRFYVPEAVSVDNEGIIFTLPAGA
jgi:hypothetical protein